MIWLSARPALLLVLALSPLAGRAQAQAQAADTTRPSDQDAHAAAPTVRAVRLQGAVALDGRLDEAAWAQAPAATEFTQIDPTEGAPASERTEVRVLFDQEALYIGARLHDRGRVASRLGRRDAFLAASDWFTVTLDSYHDHLTALRFQVNPDGVKGDEAMSNDFFGDDSWDPVWDVATSVDSLGWTAEMRIPLSQLRFSRDDQQTWGVQFQRTISRNQENAYFAFTPKKDRGGIARYGHLVGLEGLKPGRRLELLPYATARSEHRRATPGNPFRDGSDQFAGTGVDLKYRVTSNLTLDATVNPDFGQVELDPAQINLSAFETYYQERRPFFVEGANIFRFGGSSGFCFGCTQLFYSRRIGARPQLGAPGARFADMPDASTILGAAKLTGKTRNGWALGVLEAVTAREEAPFVDAQGQRGRAVVSPLTNYFVGRARRELREGRTTLGALVTAVNRDLDAPVLLSSQRSAAYVGGVDFRHEWAKRSWSLSGSLSASRISGDSLVIRGAQRSSARYFQRPDATHLEVDPGATGLAGYAASLALNREAGAHWRGGLLMNATSPGYEVNDLGFQNSVDRLSIQPYAVYLENTPGKVFRQWQVNPGFRGEWNYAGDRLDTRFYLGAFGQLKNYWGGGLNLGRGLQSYNDRFTWGGPLARTPASSQVSAHLFSDSRKAVTVNGFANRSWTDAGGDGTSLSVNVGLKTAPTWNLSVGPSVYRGNTVAQFVTSVADPLADATFGRRYLFAGLQQTTVGLGTRLNVTFTPELTLETFVQPFIATGNYQDLMELRAPRTFEFLRYGREIGTLSRSPNGIFRVDPDGDGPARPFQVPDQDFNFRSLRGSAVLRWEWRPGSTLFLVWQQRRSESQSIFSGDPLSPTLGRFDLGRDARGLFGLPAENVLLIKINYWLNP